MTVAVRAALEPQRSGPQQLEKFRFLEGRHQIFQRSNGTLHGRPASEYKGERFEGAASETRRWVRAWKREGEVPRIGRAGGSIFLGVALPAGIAMK
jgi:hypothetical protein